MPGVSVVILVQDRLGLLIRCLELAVAAGGGSGRRGRRGRQRDTALPARRPPPPAGPGDRDLPGQPRFRGEVPVGTRFSRGRHIVLLNDDTEVEPGWLGRLVEVAGSDAGIGAVGSRLLNPDGSLQEAGSILWRESEYHQVQGASPFQAAACERVRDVDYCSACGLLALATIQRLDPIYVDVIQSSVAVVALRQSLAKGGVTPASAEVRLELSSEVDYPLPGKIEFAEVTVDQTTDAVTLRARSPTRRRAAARHVRAREASEGVTPNGRCSCRSKGVGTTRRAMPPRSSSTPTARSSRARAAGGADCRRQVAGHVRAQGGRRADRRGRRPAAHRERACTPSPPTNLQ